MTADEIFFDTNIVLYLLSADLDKANRAEQLVASGGVVSVQVLNEFAEVARRKLQMPFEEIREVLSAVGAVCIVRPVDIETHELALELAQRRRFSIYDSLIVAAALRAGCRLLLTEDLQNGQTIERLRVRNPFV